MLVKILLAFLVSFPAFAMIPRGDDRIRIAVIDTGVDIMRKDLRAYLCADGHKSFVDDKVFDDSTSRMHGTNVVGLIAQSIDPGKYCIVMIKWFGDQDDGQRNNLEKETEAIDYAVSRGISYINLSLSGLDFNQAEHDALQRAIAAGIKISVAAGNDRQNLDEVCNSFPACYAKEFDPNMFHVVGSVEDPGRQSSFSNYGSIVHYIEDGEDKGNPPLKGTSQSSAIHMGKWASRQVK